MLTRQEIMERRENQAVDVLRRADVGYCRAASLLGRQLTFSCVEHTKGDTSANSIVLAAVAYAFDNLEGFKAWLDAKYDEHLTELLDECAATVDGVHP